MLRPDLLVVRVEQDAELGMERPVARTSPARARTFRRTSWCGRGATSSAGIVHGLRWQSSSDSGARSCSVRSRTAR
jgi:hypothetical protein